MITDKGDIDWNPADETCSTCGCVLDDNYCESCEKYEEQKR